MLLFVHAINRCDVYVESCDEDMLEWPSPTVDWLHGASQAPSSDDQLLLDDPSRWRQHWLVMGTMTDGKETDRLLLYSALLPACGLHAPVGAVPSSQADGDTAGKVSSSGARISNGQAASRGLPEPLTWPQDRPCFKLAAALRHPGNVDRARSMPQRGSIVATKSYSTPNLAPALHVYDLAPHFHEDGSEVEEGPMISSSCGVPAATLANQGLAWNPGHEGMLVASCQSGRVVSYQLDASGPSGQSDPTGSSTAAPQITPVAVFRGHSDRPVNDVAFAAAQGPSVFGSVAEDGTAALWDWRCRGTGTVSGGKAAAAPVAQWQAHSRKDGAAAAANGIAFSPLRPTLVATCGADGAVRVWDVRQGTGAASSSTGSRWPNPVAVKVLPSHRCQAIAVAWSPHAASWIASTDVRGLVHLWNMDYTAEAVEVAAPEAAGAAPVGPVRQGRQQQQSRAHGAILPRRPELRMIYGGHGAEVNDIVWCPDGVWGAGLLASVSSVAEDVLPKPRQREAQAEQEVDAQGEGEDVEGDEGGDVQAVPVQDPNVQIWRPALDVM